MSTTIVFACKSNSCRSQLAEGWAREWIRAQRLGLEDGAAESRPVGEEKDGDHRRLRAFLDGLLVASVALDESTVTNGTDPVGHSSTLLSSSPTSSLVANFAGGSSDARECVTCVGEVCASSSSLRRRRPKEKAVRAMAEDGVDISAYRAKTFAEVLPLIADNHRRRNDVDKHQLDPSGRNWRQYLTLPGICRVLETASREMGMAHAGIAREEDEGSGLSDDDRRRPIDKLRVLCSCPDSMKCGLSNLSKDARDWDIDPPTAAARSGEGDGAYLRVSRQIKEKVYEFMEELKRCALAAEEEVDRAGSREDAIEICDDARMLRAST